MIHACCLLAFKILERKKIHECIHIKCLRGMVVWFELTQEVDNLVRAAGYISSSILKFRVMNTNCLAVTCSRPGFGSPRTPCMKEICLGTDVMQNLSIFSILGLHHKIDRWNVNRGPLSVKHRNKQDTKISSTNWSNIISKPHVLFSISWPCTCWVSVMCIIFLPYSKALKSPRNYLNHQTHTIEMYTWKQVDYLFF